MIPGFVRTVHHIDDFADPRLVQRQSAIDPRGGRLDGRERALARRTSSSASAVKPTVGGNGVDRAAFSRSRRARGASWGNVSGLGAARCSSASAASRRARTRLACCRPSPRSRARPDARLVIAGGASLLDHHAYQAAFGRELTRSEMGPRRFRCSARSPTPTCPRSTASPPRSSSLRSRKASGFACSRRWRAERRSSSRGSRPSSTISIRPTRSGAIRPIRHRSRGDAPIAAVGRRARFARAARSSPRGSAGATSRAPSAGLSPLAGARPCLRCASSSAGPTAGAKAAIRPRSSSGIFSARARAIPSRTSCAQPAGAADRLRARARPSTATPVRSRSANSRASKRRPRNSRAKQGARVACETFLDGDAR